MGNFKGTTIFRLAILCLGIILSSVFSGFIGDLPSAQIRQEQKLALKQISLSKPKIIMDRVGLDSPKGMRIFEIKTMAIRNDLIEKLIREKGLQTTPIIFKKSPVQERVYQESERKFTRLLIDEQRGHMIMLPHLERIATARVQLISQDEALNLALEHVKTLQLIPKDESKLTPKHIVTLTRAEIKPGKPAVTTDILQTVLFQRTLDEKPVVGRGSQLFIELGDKGQLEGFSRTWNELMVSKIVPVFRSDKEIYDDIEKTLLTQLRGEVTVQVKKPRLIYFGDDRRYVQPAYFFSAEITAPNSQGKAFYWGVITALKNPPEPVMMVRDASSRILPQQTPASQGESPNFNLNEDDPGVGRYVVRDDSWDWVDDAADFRDGLLQGRSSSSPAITFGDYYWNEPRIWTTEERFFVDKWHIVLMEGHGNNWLFTTRSNCCDVVNLNSVSQPGYGDRPGDSLRFLILKGCSIIPAPPDRANWPDPWWRVFKGLRMAVGFRTSMYINDNISKHFGKHLGQNCRVLDSWFHATNSSSSYQWERFWGSWGDEVYGYGAVVMIPGHEGDSIYNTAAAPAASTTGLTIWWQH